VPTGEPRSPVMSSRGERGVWQRRYWEHTIRNDQDFATHMDYTHFKPVKHGLVEHPADWPHSSFRRSVASGIYPAGWLGGSDEPRETGRAVVRPRWQTSARAGEGRPRRPLSFAATPRRPTH
jgi:putative transposase